MGRINYSERVLARREREKRERIDTILDAALEVFSEKGFYNARMEDIAEKAALGKGTLYYYFRTKEELYLTLLKREESRLTETLVSSINPDTSIEDFIIQVVRFFIDYFSEHKEYISVLFPIQSGFISFKDSELVKEIENLRSEFTHIAVMREMIEKILGRCKQKESGESILYFLAIIIRGIGDFIRTGQSEKVKKSIENILSELNLCKEKELRDEVD